MQSRTTPELVISTFGEPTNGAEQYSDLKVAAGPFELSMISSDGTALPLISRQASGMGADLLHFGKNGGVPMHSHPGDHLLIVIAGSGVLNFYDEEHQITTGKIYWIPGGAPHAIRASSHLTLISIANNHIAADRPERLTLDVRSQ